MSDLDYQPDGAMPLDPDDFAGLRRSDIAQRPELNEAEALNIMEAHLWAFQRRHPLSRLLTQKYLRALHKRMFGDVWSWAGDLRKRETSIGINPHLISTELENLLLNTQAQTQDLKQLAWPADELALRFHHRCVSIHPFVNGNERHARLMADLLVIELGSARFTWGRAGHLTDKGHARDSYLTALRVADKKSDYQPLLTFARS